MKGFKKCKNGHYYPENLEHCPYCPSGETQGNDEDKTRVAGNNQNIDDNEATTLQNDNMKTHVPGGDSPNDFIPGQKTEIIDGEDLTQQNQQQGRDFTKTYIPGMEEVVQGADGQEKIKQSKPREYRKLVGWLVTYDIDPKGVDYRLYEGKNPIGSRPEHSITVVEPTISGIHATILFRNGKFRIKDEFSTAGTYVNNKEVEEDIKIHDGDEIKLGNVKFKFRTAF